MYKNDLNALPLDIHSINARTKREKPGDENFKIDGDTKTKFSEPNDPLWKDMW